jgi:hypothetical protein
MTPAPSSSRPRRDFSSQIDNLLRQFQENPQRRIQINVIAAEAGIEKRRLYDLMNVLVACGVCLKTDTHTYCWNGISSFLVTARNITAHTEQLAQITPLDRLFVLPDAPPIGLMATSFLSMYFYFGIGSINISHASVLMSQDEPHAQSVRRRLYLVAFLLQHIGILRHGQTFGVYLIMTDVSAITKEALSTLGMRHEFQTDSIEYHLNRIEDHFVHKMFKERQIAYAQILEMRNPADTFGVGATYDPINQLEEISF